MSVVLRLLIVAGILLLTPTADAGESWKLIPEMSQINFIGNSTLHSFHGKAQGMSGEFEQAEASARGNVSVDVQRLTTDNPARDKNMFRMFDAVKHPKILFAIDQMDWTQVAGNKSGEVMISGVLTIHTVSRPVTTVAKARWSDGILILEGALDVSLKTYDLRPPSMLMVVRVSDQVHVNYDFAFKK